MYTFELNTCVCFKELHDMGLIYSLFIDICIDYITESKPVNFHICSCCRCKPVFQMLFELEKREYLKIFEKDLESILVVPVGVNFSKVKPNTVFLCNCGECYD